MVVFMAQFGVGLHPGHADLLGPLTALLVAAGTGGLAVLVLGQVVPRTRRAVRRPIVRRRRLRAAANAEVRARGMMDELCPYGWRAQITLYRASEEQLADSPLSQRDCVAIDWAAFESEDYREPIVRRVWASTISEALDAMVADRRTDETLQHVEQDALAEGAMWEDP
jgi:hypothetical protein